MTATAIGPLQVGDRLVSRDGQEATVVKMELRGGLDGAPWETWAQLTPDDGVQRWVKVEGSELDPEADGDEEDVLDVIRERLEMGRGTYGPLRLDSDPRDFEHEALEELLDGCVYLSCELLRRERCRSPTS